MNNTELITISYIKSCGNYILKYYYDGRSRQMLRSTLKDVESKYCITSLVRIHKQLIVNLRHIQSYTVVNNKHVVTVRGCIAPLTVSKSYLNTFLQQFNKSQAPVVFTKNDPGYLFL